MQCARRRFHLCEATAKGTPMSRTFALLAAILMIKISVQIPINSPGYTDSISPRIPR
jgi:hypothetical protein